VTSHPYVRYKRHLCLRSAMHHYLFRKITCRLLSSGRNRMIVADPSLITRLIGMRGSAVHQELYLSWLATMYSARVRRLRSPILMMERITCSQLGRGTRLALVPILHQRLLWRHQCLVNQWHRVFYLRVKLRFRFSGLNRQVVGRPSQTT
jgi:hypothetical protein